MHSADCVQKATGVRVNTTEQKWKVERCRGQTGSALTIMQDSLCTLERTSLTQGVQEGAGVA